LEDTAIDNYILSKSDSVKRNFKENKTGTVLQKRVMYDIPLKTWMLRAYSKQGL